jgi:hypothetical protein
MNLYGALPGRGRLLNCFPGAFAARLISDAAAAAKTVSVFIQARASYPKAILVESFGHSLRFAGGDLIP